MLSLALGIAPLFGCAVEQEATPPAIAPVAPASTSVAATDTFVVVRGGASLRFAEDETAPTLRLPVRTRGYAFVVVEKFADRVVVETAARNVPDCTDGGEALDWVRMRWLVRSSDLMQVVTRRVRSEFGDGTQVELLTGTPLIPEGRGWIALVAEVGIHTQLPLDAVGHFYAEGDRELDSFRESVIAAGSQSLSYDSGRELADDALARGDDELVGQITDAPDGRRFANLDVGCATLRVVLPPSRGVSRMPTYPVLGTYGGGSPLEPGWNVAAGTTAYWVTGGRAGVVVDHRVWQDNPREVGERQCFGVAALSDDEAFELCFDRAAVIQVVGPPSDEPQDLGELFAPAR